MTVDNRWLLLVTAVLEVGAGLAFAVWPSIAVSLLLGSALESPAAVTIGRLAGAALFSLGLACWMARDDARGHAASGLVTAMLVYNAAAAVLLGYVATGLRLGGIGLWPAVVLHLAMAAWCLAGLRSDGNPRAQAT